MIPELPDNLYDRNILREDSKYDFLKRMTIEEEKIWFQEAFIISLKELIDERIKPSYQKILEKINLKIKFIENRPK